MYIEQNKYAIILVLLLFNFSCWTYSDVSKELDKEINDSLCMKIQLIIFVKRD